MQPPKWPDALPCVDKFAGEDAKENLEQIIDRSTVHKSGPLTTELIRTTCDKQIYRRGNFLIIIYSLPAATSYVTDPRLAVRGYAEPVPPDQTPAGAMACLARAKADVLAIDVGAQTLNAYSQKFANIADDPDVGPAHYLNCTGTGDLSYQRSLSIMIHELTHENTMGNCLYTSYAPGYLCFDLPSDLPSASIATDEELFDSDDAYLKKLGKAQQLYLFEFTKTNRGPATLFNELNAYTAGLEVSSALLKQHGSSGLLEKDGQPEPALLPLVMLWTVKYLAQMRDQNADLYSSTFAPGTGNRNNVNILLEHGETAYLDWTTQLDRRKIRRGSSEKEIWAQYLEAKKQLNASRAAS
jgi:hypothetical protein